MEESLVAKERGKNFIMAGNIEPLFHVVSTDSLALALDVPPLDRNHRAVCD